MIAATRMPVPVIVRMLNLKIAASMTGLGTAGGIFWTSLSRPGMANCGSHSPSMNFLKLSVPQMNTETQRMTQGSQAWATVISRPWLTVRGALRISSSLGTSWPGAERVFGELTPA